MFQICKFQSPVSYLFIYENQVMHTRNSLWTYKKSQRRQRVGCQVDDLLVDLSICEKNSGQKKYEGRFCDNLPKCVDNEKLLLGGFQCWLSFLSELKTFWTDKTEGLV